MPFMRMHRGHEHFLREVKLVCLRENIAPRRRRKRQKDSYRVDLEQFTFVLFVHPLLSQ